MKLARQSSRIAVLISLMATTSALCALTSHAQTPEKSAKPVEPTLDIVSPAALSRNVDRTVTVHGIIGDYHIDKNHYNLHADDGSDVEVIGTYPEQPHVRYVLRARVARDNGHYVLQELSKERDASGGGANRDPLLIAGVVLILAAAITMAVMVTRNRTAQQRMVMEQQIDEERRRAEAARADAERARLQADRAQKSDGPGATVATGAAGAAGKPKPAHTIISIGAVEVVGGPHMGMKFPLQHGETRIGRSADTGCDIVLDKDHEVSSYHGSLIVTVDGRIIYKDGSTNGSVLEGTTVHHGQAEAASGALLNIGGSTLCLTVRGASGSQPVVPTRLPSAVAAGSVPAAVMPERSMPSPVSGASNGNTPQGFAALPPRSAPTVEVEMPSTAIKRPAAPTQLGFGAELEAISGTASGRRFVITRPITTIGREDRDILLDDDTVSRKHATLTVRDGAFLLTDDGSTHGTRVNGEPIGPKGQALVDGDLVTCGNGDAALMFHKVGV
ncbi:MAG: peptide-binding protein [Chthonomonadaceae bacterium]|nr:peptide-binding protein [Chthonomonadaceae bacterium]